MIDVEALEESLVQQTPLFVVTAEVELLRSAEQLETQVDQSRGFREVSFGLCELARKALSAQLEVAELGVDLGFGVRRGLIRVSRQIDQIVFLCSERLQLGCQLSVLSWMMSSIGN